MSSWASQAVLFFSGLCTSHQSRAFLSHPGPQQHSTLLPHLPQTLLTPLPLQGLVSHRRLSHSLLHQWLTSKPPSHLSHSPRLCISICQWSSEHQEIQCTSDQFAWNQFDKEPIYWSAILVNYFKFHCVSNFNTVITLQCLITLHTNKDQYGDRNP